LADPKQPRVLCCKDGGGKPRGDSRIALVNRCVTKRRSQHLVTSLSKKADHPPARGKERGPPNRLWKKKERPVQERRRRLTPSTRRKREKKSKRDQSGKCLQDSLEPGTKEARKGGSNVGYL